MLFLGDIFSWSHFFILQYPYPLFLFHQLLILSFIVLQPCWCCTSWSSSNGMCFDLRKLLLHFFHFFSVQIMLPLIHSRIRYLRHWTWKDGFFHLFVTICNFGGSVSSYSIENSFSKTHSLSSWKRSRKDCVLCVS